MRKFISWSLITVEISALRIKSNSNSFILLASAATAKSFLIAASLSILRKCRSTVLNTTFADLANSARDGNEIAIAAIAAGTDALAVGIVNVAATVDVGLVVVGGGVSRAGDVYWSPLLSAIKRRAKGIEFLSDMQIKPAMLESNAGVIGAALATL